MSDKHLVSKDVQALVAAERLRSASRPSRRTASPCRQHYLSRSALGVSASWSHLGTLQPEASLTRMASVPCSRGSAPAEAAVLPAPRGTLAQLSSGYPPVSVAVVSRASSTAPSTSWAGCATPPFVPQMAPAVPSRMASSPVLQRFVSGPPPKTSAGGLTAFATCSKQASTMRTCRKSTWRFYHKVRLKMQGHLCPRGSLFLQGRVSDTHVFAVLVWLDRSGRSSYLASCNHGWSAT